MIGPKRPCLFGWDTLTSGISTFTDTLASVAGGASLSDIADTVANANITTLVDAGSNALGNLTAAQVAAGVQSAVAQPKPAVSTPVSPQVSSTIAKVGLSTAAIVGIGLGAYFLLGRD